LRIHYKKQWQNEGKAMVDRSTVGLYFTTAPARGREIQSFTIDRPKGAETNTLAGALPVRARVLALRPSLDRVYGTIIVQAITPAGGKIPLLRLRTPRPEWRRRYWLAQPVELPAGSLIEMNALPPSSYIDLTDSQFVRTYPMEVALDFVPGS
jgi:hypothetical protein